MREATRLLAESADALQDLAANEAAVSAQQEQMCDRVCSALVQKMRETMELKVTGRGPGRAPGGREKGIQNLGSACLLPPRRN